MDKIIMHCVSVSLIFFVVSHSNRHKTDSERSDNGTNYPAVSLLYVLMVYFLFIGALERAIKVWAILNKKMALVHTEVGFL